MLIYGLVSPLKRIYIDRFMAKEYTHWTRWFSQPCSRSLYASLPGRTASNAPLTSIVRKEAFWPLKRASSTSCVRHIVRSTDDRSGKAPNYWLFRTYRVTASYASFRAISLSSPFPRTDRSAIGLYDRGEVRSALFSLGIIARTAIRKQAG